MKWPIFLVFLIFICNSASAGTYLFQGDKVYWGDTVDLTGVYGWACTVAWWKGGYNPAVSPTIIEDVCTNSYNVRVTPERFPQGIWYKWDGKVSSSGNERAFEVVGPRPTTIQPTSNITSNPTLNLTAAPIQVITTTQPTLVPTEIPTIQSAIQSTPITLEISVAPTAQPVSAETTEAGSIWPNLPPLPILLVLLFCGGLVVYWWINGNM